MRRRLLYGSGSLLLAVLVTLVVWQGSFHFGEYAPATPEQTVLIWAVSTLIFVLTVTLAFMLARTGLKLYVERRANRQGSRIRTKLVAGALALSILPVLFLVLFSIEVMNRNLAKWFARPAETIRGSLSDISNAFDQEAIAKAHAQARWLAGQPALQGALATPSLVQSLLQPVCRDHAIYAAYLIDRQNGVTQRHAICAPSPPLMDHALEAMVALSPQQSLVVQARLPLNVVEEQRSIRKNINDYNDIVANSKQIRGLYLRLMTLITLFVLFLATWIALFFAKQISGPITALLEAAGEVRRGNLSHRVETRATDEIASLVRAFNEMTQELEANSRELERRRQFMEAILESIPTGVLSLSATGQISKVNRALRGMFPPHKVDTAEKLEDLLASEDAAEVRYLMNRARRTGLAASQFEFASPQGVQHLYATVSALEDGDNSGFVLVLEDASELLRAQKSAAWHEVARRVAHEIKNPLTPIALGAERIMRQLERAERQGTLPAASLRAVQECAGTILGEVETLRTLVDEFAQFSRLPAAQPAAADLNEIVEAALSVFAGRLQGVQVTKQLAPQLPAVWVDREQFKRVIVNLVDNAAEAMENASLRQLTITTQAAEPDRVELTISDTGCGVSQADKEKLFLPYFSTKNRGTGLGLAIVNRILSDHNVRIQVEDNRPSGATFLLEIPTADVSLPRAAAPVLA